LKVAFVRRTRHFQPCRDGKVSPVPARASRGLALLMLWTPPRNTQNPLKRLLATGGTFCVFNIICYLTLLKSATMAQPKVFSLEGKGLKLDTKADVEAHIKPLREMEDVTEVRLLGNTLGVEACQILGEVLETKKTLEVFIPSLLQSTFLY